MIMLLEGMNNEYFYCLVFCNTQTFLCLCSQSRFRMISLKDVSGRKTAMVSLRNCLYLLPLGYIAYDCELWLNVSS